MRRLLRSGGALLCVLLLSGVAMLVSAARVNAANLLGYYEFQGNYDNSSGPLGAAIPTENPTQVNFAGLGFRGQAVDINDPEADGGGNTGGSLRIPHNANPNESPEVTFGAWVNLESNNNFPGFMAIDNGGWDRGLHLNGNNWGIASGGNSAGLGGPATVGQWQYVVGTFNKPANRATIYVGDANPAVQTTTGGTRPDGGVNPGEVQIEIGRYDNQDLDALVDDAFVFDAELNPHQANAIRNLRLSSHDLSVADAAVLFDLFDAGAGTANVGGLTFSHTSGLVATNPGAVQDFGAVGLNVVLSDDGRGLAAVIPEPSSLVLGSVALLLALGIGWRRRKRIS